MTQSLNDSISSPQWPRDWDAPIPAHIQGLIFDCDGTVVDTMPVHYAAWCKALGEAGIAFPEERFYALAGATATSIAAMLAKEQGVQCDPAEVAHHKEALYEASLENLVPITKVVEIAKREQGRRKLAIASGGRLCGAGCSR
jgi:beta-phosphoglucomutase-like phosphatase (HAD superfamily)